MNPIDDFLFLKHNRVSYDSTTLIQLYYPIMGSDALAVYEYLVAFFDNGAHTHNVRAKYTNNCETKSGVSARANGGGSNTSDYRFGDTDSQGAHGHNVSTNASTTGSNGSGSAFSIMPPYKGVYIWQRIA